MPCSQLLDQGIRSFQLPWGVQTLQEEGLDGAGIAPEQGSDLSWRVLLEPSCVILLLQVQLEEQEFPALCPSRKTGEQSIPCCAQAEQELLGWAQGDGNLQWAGLDPAKLDFPRISAPPQQGLV